MEPPDEDVRGDNEDDSYEKWLFRQHVYEFEELDTGIRKAFIVERISIAELAKIWKRDHGE